MPSGGGIYGGGTIGVPTPIGGLGGGAYVDGRANIYPQLYWGTPGLRVLGIHERH